MTVDDQNRVDRLLREMLLEALEAADVHGDELVDDPAAPASQRHLLDMVRGIRQACDLLPLPRLEAMATAASDAVEALNGRRLVPTAAAMTTILSAIGRMREILDQTEADGAEPPGDDDALIDALAAVANGRAAPAAEAAPGTGDALFVVFRMEDDLPLAIEAAHVAWLDAADAVAAGPDGTLQVEVRGQSVPLVAPGDNRPVAGPLVPPRPVIVLIDGERRVALLVADVIAVAAVPAAPVISPGDLRPV